MTQPELHIYTNEVTDWIIAASEEDANAVLSEHYDLPLEGLREEGLEITAQWPDDKPLSIRDEHTDERKTQLPHEWASQEGRGLLCSNEY